MSSSNVICYDYSGHTWYWRLEDHAVWDVVAVVVNEALVNSQEGWEVPRNKGNWLVDCIRVLDVDCGVDRFPSRGHIDRNVKACVRHAAADTIGDLVVDGWFVKGIDWDP